MTNQPINRPIATPAPVAAKRQAFEAAQAAGTPSPKKEAVPATQDAHQALGTPAWAWDAGAELPPAPPADPAEATYQTDAQAFLKQDADRNGYLSSDEAPADFQRIDSNADGKLSFDEYLNRANPLPAPEAAPEEVPIEPVTPAEPAPGTVNPETGMTAEEEAAIASLTPERLAELGRTDPAAFFEALRPAAEAAERLYGVPAAITLAQAALESSWGEHGIGGYNIFGMKGTGPAGSVDKETWEHLNGQDVTVVDTFALFNNYGEAILEHGELFHNGYYDQAMAQYAQDGDPFAFAYNITGIYATDPAYGDKITNIIRTYGLA